MSQLEGIRKEMSQFLLPLSVSLAFWPGILSPATSPRWWAIAIGMGMVCPIRGWRRLSPPITILLLLSSLSIFLSIRNPVALGEAIHWLLLGMAFLWGTSLKDFRPIICGFSIGLLVNSIIAIFQYFGWDGISEWQSAGPGGLFYNREVLAELAAPIFVWGAVAASTPTILCSIIPLFLCHSRVAIITIFTGCLFMHLKWWSRAAILGIGIVIIGIISIENYKYFSLFDRLDTWKLALSELSFFGKGLAYWELQHPESHYVHSDVLQLMVEVGIIPTLPILFLPILIIWKSRHAQIAPEYFAIAVALLLEMVISFPLHQPATAFLMAVLWGHLARHCQGAAIIHRSMVQLGQPFSRANTNQDLESARKESP